ncbi:pitrilysin [Utexia brackfieldae]|uniref:pitrilysin n=1 Tax=Utexia brackfieldae TaxID=3074108 RepID=UPI00370D9B91
MYRYFLPFKPFSSVITRLLIHILLIFSASVMANQAGYQILPDTIIKSQRDDRQYQAIQLANDMKVLLVSDPQAVKSLGGLAVSVGSLQDPSSQQGLAHYTEHMVLMGSKNFPEPDGFAEFLSKHAGNYNASTMLNRTTFYFEVENAALKPALTRLSDAIAFPLLDPHYADKERNAVNAELTLARSRDGFRIKQIDAETINPAHPAAQFTGGNLETLSDKPNSVLQNELSHFYDTYYSANLMVGVIYGQPSLAELANLAVETFGQIKNYQAQISPLTTPAITEKQMAKMIYMEPAQSKRVLYLQFPIANNLADFASKSDEYIGYMIANKSQHTLADTLQKQGLIDSISAGGAPTHYGNSGLFTIAISLTERGLAEKDQVIAAVFDYIKLLKSQGINQAYYDEIARVMNLEFKYQTISRDMDYVQWLTGQMLDYPIAHILDADYVAERFDQEVVLARLNQLTCERARIWVIAPNQVYDKQAYFIQAPYRISGFTPQQQALWQGQGSQWHFALPEVNPFIPDNFGIIDAADLIVKSSAFNPQGNILYFPSHYFANEPKAVIVLSLRQNAILDSAKQQTMFGLLDYLSSRAMSQLRFQAGVAGIDLDTGTDDGIMLTASGFSQHLPEMMMAMLDRYQHLTINEDDLALAKSWYLQQLSSADNVTSYALALQPIQALNSSRYIEREQRRQALSTISVDDLRAYRDQLMIHSAPYLFALGNMPAKTLADLYEEVKSSLKLTDQFTPTARMQINQPHQVLLKQTSSSTDNALTMVYIATGDNEIIDKTQSVLLAKILTPWFYQQLRSEEQLGYVVTSLPVSMGKASGIGFLVQSNQYTPSQLYQRYLAFYPHALAKLKALSPVEFAQYKNGLLAELQEPPQTMDEEVDRYLPDFLKSTFNFDTREKMIVALKQLSQQQVIAFYQSLVIKNQGLSIASVVKGADAEDKLAAFNRFEDIENASTLQKQLLSEQ